VAAYAAEAFECSDPREEDRWRPAAQSAIRAAIAAVGKRNRPAIVDPKRIGELMRAIDGYGGDASAEFALRLLPLTFV
jgi:hypothetical protein